MSQNKNLIRNQNIDTLKKFLFHKETALKAEMSKETGISVVTINSLVKELVEENVLIEGDLTQQPLGRPAITYHFNYEQSHFLLLSIQEMKIKAERKLILIGKIVNLAGTVLYDEKINFQPVTLDFLLKNTLRFLAMDTGIEKIGLSFPGKIHNGTVLSSWENLFDHWRIEEAFAQQTSIPVIIQNDAHLLTVGYTILTKLHSTQTIVGIFYPENSMPGITIYSEGKILEGGHHLAGEAKFLPHLIHSSVPSNEVELINNLVEIIAIYNAVIAPDAFVISAESINQINFLNAIENSSVITKQIYQPKIFFITDFQEALTIGLRWLVTKDSPYQL